MAHAKKFEVEVTVPEGVYAGDTFKVVVEAPELPKQTRGQLNGIAIEDMTDEQLKREIINANSVLYKAVKRGAESDTIAKNQARVDAAKAEKEKRTPVVATTGAVVEDAEVDEELAAEM